MDDVAAAGILGMEELSAGKLQYSYAYIQWRIQEERGGGAPFLFTSIIFFQ